MEAYQKIEDVTETVYKRKGKRYKPTSDTIYTYDIEVSSIYKLDGVWQSFDYSRPQKDYMGIEKVGIPYIWMFGINDNVYYGRHFLDTIVALKKISDPVVRKIVWVHNLSYEFHFLRAIFDNFTIEEMCCRDALKPISFVVKELNIQFRCSYMLTNMSLDTASKEYGTVFKRTGTFDYNKLRGESTPLTKVEEDYCCYDCLSLKSIIAYFLRKWGHLINIPLTSTGEVRKALRDRLDYWYFLNTSWQLVPDADMYLKLWNTFAGGYTHANMLLSNRILYNVKSKDIASSYPFSLCCMRYPVKPFKEFSEERYNKLKKYDSYAWFFEVRIHGLQSKFYNHYISYSKIYNHKANECVTDNGRLASCEGKFDLYLTDVDLEIIETNYTFDKIEFLQIYGAYKDYLDKRIIRFILDMYKNKTMYKGLADKVDLYKQSKSYVNAIYGLSVTNVLKNSASYDIGDEDDEDYGVLRWRKLKVDDNDEKARKKFDAFVEKTLEGQKKSYSNLIYYATGLWVTSYSRRNVYLTLLKIDSEEAYCDTDSIKYIGNHDDIFEEYNKQVVERYKALIKKYPEFTLDDFMPTDSKGVKHPLGFFEDDGEYEEFITLGAKKYAYRENGELHITCAGVAKSGVRALHDDINEFRKGKVFGYNDSGKLTHIYIDNQPPMEFYDYMGNLQYADNKYGVVLQPTTYTIGVTPEYESLFNSIQEEVFRNNG